MNCEYCNKQFSNKGNLHYHQKTAKYCLELRESNSVENHICKFCGLNFTRKSNLQAHESICKEKIYQEYKVQKENLQKKFKELENLNLQQEQTIKILNQRVEEYKLETNFLKNQIIELAGRAIDRPTNYNTDQRTTMTHSKMIDNRVLNMIPLNLTHDKLIQTLEEKFTENHLMQGQKGVAEFMLENILVNEDEGDKKYLMKCTDPSRRVFITIDESGNIVKDVNAQKLTKIISDPVKDKCHRLYEKIHDRFFTFYKSIGDELEDDDEEKKSLDVENDRFEHATNQVVEIGRLKNDNNEFVKSLIPSLVN